MSETYSPNLHAPITLKLCTLLVIGWCLFALAVCVDDFIHPSDLGSICLFFWTVPFLTAFTTQSYRGTFDKNPTAALWAGTLSMLTFMLFATMVVVAVLASISQTESKIPPLTLPSIIALGSLFAMMLVLGVMAWKSFAWRQKLLDAKIDQQQANRTFGIGTLCALMISVGVVIGLVRYFDAERLPQLGEHLSPDEVPVPVPANATDISYFQSYGASCAFEFTIDEAGFEKWFYSDDLYLRADTRKLKEIPGFQLVDRYMIMSGGERDENSTIDVPKGLVFDYTDSFNESSYTNELIVFDREHNRVYCYFRYFTR